MTCQSRDLEPVYDPAAGYTHFVLYSEPKYGIGGATWNGTVSIERESPYVTEWLGRLQPCAPNTLHTTLVESNKIADLFHACVDDDQEERTDGGPGPARERSAPRVTGLPLLTDRRPYVQHGGR